jgi:hypothetical protein
MSVLLISVRVVGADTTGGSVGREDDLSKNNDSYDSSASSSFASPWMELKSSRSNPGIAEASSKLK